MDMANFLWKMVAQRQSLSVCTEAIIVSLLIWILFLPRQPIEFSNDRLAMYDTFSFSLDNMHLWNWIHLYSICAVKDWLLAKCGSNRLLVQAERPRVLRTALFHSVWKPRTASVLSCQFWLPYQAEQYVCSNFAFVALEANAKWQLSLFTELMYILFLYVTSLQSDMKEQCMFPKYFTEVSHLILDPLRCNDRLGFPLVLP